MYDAILFYSLFIKVENVEIFELNLSTYNFNNFEIYI